MQERKRELLTPQASPIDAKVRRSVQKAAALEAHAKAFGDELRIRKLKRLHAADTTARSQ